MTAYTSDLSYLEDNFKLVITLLRWGCPHQVPTDGSIRLSPSAVQCHECACRLHL